MASWRSEELSPDLPYDPLRQPTADVFDSWVKKLRDLEWVPSREYNDNQEHWILSLTSRPKVDSSMYFLMRFTTSPRFSSTCLFGLAQSDYSTEKQQLGVFMRDDVECRCAANVQSISIWSRSGILLASR